ncbi:MAG: nucleotide exchange factor GrpE [Candidatus Paceibacterota bacterium]|nr:nucleotide exchange factor GrpE [Candidatus Paceibacterota bacterium]HPD55442.1 nucleotide exchange factor GrpE [Candidatus Paceibacterota bacterium]HQM34918.1 nucleotide exchange factor GrpE [Candidatus Paceibacterota bacterium]
MAEQNKNNQMDAEEKEIKEKLQDLTQKLEECEKLKEEYLNGWQRERAAFLNYQKDTSKRIEEIIKMANEGLIRELLSVLDSFDISVNSLNVEGLTPTEKNIVRGIELIRGQLLDVLKQQGLKEIQAIGSQFDPHLHEAIDIVKGGKDGEVAEELIKGYTLNDKVIRPAKVKVFKEDKK